MVVSQISNDGKTLYCHDVKVGRHPTPDPKTITPLRLYESTRARIAALGLREQEFIEAAVYERLDCCNTETAQP